MPWGYRVTASDMKQSLPWSVTGIPPEAREAARTAASREGLSVGDWLTRRILGETPRAFGEGEPGGEPESEWRASTSAPRRFARDRDDETLRDREDLITRIARAEAESDSAFRHIDETLRTMTRRLETAERSQNEANRAMGVAAAEINTAAREQVSAFSQLAERIERVEQHADSSTLKDAVRGLHQGLSRLADQIARTATESSTQVSSLAANVESIAGKVAVTREEASHAGQSIEGRIATLTDRVKAAEVSSESAMKALRTALGLFESRLASAEPKTDEVERSTQAIQNLERTVEQIAQRLTAAESRAGAAEEKVQEALGRQLSAIEKSFENLAQRLDASEKQSREALSELRTNFGETTKRLDAFAKPAASVFDEPVRAPMAAPILDLPPLPDVPPPPPDYAPPPGFEPASAFTPSAAFEPAPPAFASAPAQAPEAPPGLQAVPQDYLAAARRAALAAAEAEPQQATHGPLGSFRSWSESESRTGIGRTALIGTVVLLIVVAALAGILLTRGLGHGPSEAISQQNQAVGQLFNPANKPPAVAEGTQNSSSSLQNAPNGESTDGASLPSRPLPRDTGTQFIGAAAPSLQDNQETAPPPSQQATEQGPAPEQATPQTAAPAVKAAPQKQTMAALSPPETAKHSAPADQLMTKAKAGDAKAELLLGSKYLDGDGVAANDGEAVRWLQKSAAQGEPMAQYRLGTMYERGRGVPADAKQAHNWYAEAARHGNRKAMHNLAVSFAQGTGTDKNFAEAAHWFTAAAELGLVDSQFNLAVLYERGLGVLPSLRDAYKWYAIAAAQGDAESKTRLDALATQLTPEDKQAAEKAAAAFHPQPLNRDANEAPTMAQVVQ